LLRIGKQLGAIDLSRLTDAEIDVSFERTPFDPSVIPDEQIL
jgi:hypothetical protein